MNLTCPTKAILREERSEEVEHARVAPREEEAFLRGKDSNIIGNCPLFPLLLFFSLPSTIFSREKVMEQRSVSCFSFWRIFFGLRETKLIILLHAFWERIEQQFVKSFFLSIFRVCLSEGKGNIKICECWKRGGEVD